jgi:hypothetical protein
MPRNNYYVDPLLSNLAVDWSQKVREGLIGPTLFPRIPVTKPSGKYAIFDKENAYKIPDDTMSGERAQANEFETSGTMKEFATSPHGLKSFIDAADLEMMDGPFRTWEKQKVENLTGKLEVNQEKRIASTILGLPNRSAIPATKWSDGGGDPVTDIQNGVKQIFFRPNTMVLSEAVFDALEYHPKMLAKLGEANLIKKVDEQNLAKLFRVDHVYIAQGRADFGKRNKDKTVDPQSVWGDSVVLAYTSNVWNQPCAGKTVAVKYAEADNLGYVVRSWPVEDGGLLGGEYVQVAMDCAELVVCDELVYTLKEVL